MVRAAGLARADGRGPLIQRCVLPFMRNVAEAVLLWGASFHRVWSQATFQQRIWVRILDLETVRKNKRVILMKLNPLLYLTVGHCGFPPLTPGFTGRGTCGMLSIFGDGTAAGTPMCFGLTVRHIHEPFQYTDAGEAGPTAHELSMHTKKDYIQDSIQVEYS